MKKNHDPSNRTRVNTDAGVLFLHERNSMATYRNTQRTPPFLVIWDGHHKLCRSIQSARRLFHAKATGTGTPKNVQLVDAQGHIVMEINR
jgi:hypothetical protein